MILMKAELVTIFGRTLSLVVLCAMVGGCARSTPVVTSTAAVDALKYLDEQEGVMGHEVEGNCVYVVFPKPPPKDWESILKDAALAGNVATGFEFVASGIASESDNWRAYVDSNTLGVMTARDDEIVQ